MSNNSILSKAYDSLALTNHKFNHTLLLPLFLLGSLLITGQLCWSTSHFSSWVSKSPQYQSFLSLVSGEEYQVSQLFLTYFMFQIYLSSLSQWIIQVAFFSLLYEILVNQDYLVCPIVRFLHDLTGKTQLLAKIAALEKHNISLRTHSTQLTSDRELICRRLLVRFPSLHLVADRRNN